MNILRLSLFNLKKNRKEAAAIAFLTMVTALMLAVFMMNQTKMHNSFDDSFAASGSRNYCAAFKEKKYRDEYREILENMPGVHDIIEDEIIGAFSKDVEKDGEILSYSLVLVTEKTERKIEDFVRKDSLSDDEIAALSHPIWLPVYFQNAAGYQPGELFTVIIDGIRYDFEIAGFYETGLMASDGYGFKCVVSENDYAMFKMLLNAGSDSTYTALWFNSDTKLLYNDFFRICSESSSENLENSTWFWGFHLEKQQALQFINLFLYFLAFFSAVTMLSALFVITHRISNDIEDQMQQIGVLEALGYRSREISLSYVCEYLICAGIGALLGGILALVADPAMDIGIQNLTGRTANSSVEIVKLILAVLCVVGLVISIALIKAARVRKYPPVVAFRKGIRTHHFGRNILPLEKSKRNINVSLAFKSFIGDLRSSFGVALCVVISGIAILFCVNCFHFFRNGIDGLISLAGMDVTVNVELMNGVDPYTLRDEIAAMPEVRKAMLAYGSVLDNYITVKNSDNRAMAVIFDDFSQSENIQLIRGRFPEHDNEIMTTVARCSAEGLDIGDSLILEGNGVENKYIITGISSSLLNNGMGVFLTTDGFLRTNFNDRPRFISVYLAEGTDQAAFEKHLYEKYGKSVKDCISTENTGDSTEERIRTEADKKIAMLVSYYGVTNVDYAVALDDQIISGNSRGFVIKEVSSLMGMAKQQMEPAAVVTKTGSVVAVIVISVVVAVILGLIVSGTVKRQRRSLGILKGMGYSSKDLMIQLSLKTMPVTVLSVIIAAVLTDFVYSGFWMIGFHVFVTMDIPVTIAASILLIGFCYAVTYICAGKVKAISVTELMTE